MCKGRVYPGSAGLGLIILYNSQCDDIISVTSEYFTGLGLFLHTASPTAVLNP